MGALAGDRFEEVDIPSAHALGDWLDRHCRQQDGAWIVTYKQAVPDKYVPHDQILDLVIAYGWCDGIKRRVDAERSMQLISPRRTQPWAKSYKDRADRLTANGAMRPTGIEAVQQAKATGMWEAMNDVDALIVPDDLRTALQSSSPADHYFNAFPPSTRRNVLRWIAMAKTTETRTKRIALTVEEARANRRVKSNG